MACKHCGSTAEPLHGRCAGCGTPLTDLSPTIATGVMTPPPPSRPGDDETRVMPPTGGSGGGAAPPAGPGAPAAGWSNTGPLSVGQNFGSRYHLIRLLGIGGMGAVYQAWDRTLEVAVAVKVIRPEPSADPEAARALERRFKRELLLARQVTHRNVVRIHDLGEIEGITYITMPYIQGSDLSTILKRDGRLPVSRVLSLAKEIGSGLAAAHQAGVVHRDLKPANIMVDLDGSAQIMDFGIARSTSTGPGMTMTAGGAIVGTIEYMAPEQARGVDVDQRADIYAFGLILHDLLLGRRQGESQTAVAELMQRMQHAPAPVRSVDPAIPAAVDAIVTKCVQPDPAHRFQTMAELIAEIDRLDENGHPRLNAGPSAVSTAPVLPSSAGTQAATAPIGVGAPKPARWKVVALAAGLILAIGLGAWALRGQFVRRPPPAPAGPAISLAILPFRNNTGDPTLDAHGSSLSQVLSTMLQSPRVRTVPGDRLHQVLQDLRIGPNATVAPVELARVADLTSARRVLSGSFTRFGDAIRVDATLQDLDRGDAASLSAMAPNEAGLLTAMSELADSVRANLARGSPDVLSELKSTAWKPTTGSFEALRLYQEGLQLTREGNHQEAQKRFLAATKLDENFALAFSALALSSSTLGYDDQAGQYSRTAMSLGASLPPQEKYLIAATHYRILNETEKAIDSYENLVKATPNDATIQFDLGTLYEESGKFDQAQKHFAKVVELDPKFIEGLRALGRIEIRRGNPQASLEHLNGALTLAIQLRNDEARANILQAIGVAYKRLANPDEALRHYAESLEIKRRLKNKRGMASSLNEIAQVQDTLGRPRESEKSFREALTLYREIGDKSGTGLCLVNLASLLYENLGRPDEAMPMLQEALGIFREMGDEPSEGLAINNIGGVHFAKGRFSEAQTQYERALQIREKVGNPKETADTLHNLGETLSKLGRYDQSLSRYLKALELRRAAEDRRGAAIESYSIGTIFDYQGRYGAALKSKEEALKTFREIKQRDLWLPEALSGYGNSLSLSGRAGEADKHFAEALAVGKEIQNPTMLAQTMRFQADRLAYAGDLKAAKTMADQAAQTASAASDRGQAMLAQAAAVAAAAALEPTRPLATRLSALAAEADGLGLKFLSVQCLLQRAAALHRLGDQATARQEVDRALARSEQLGLRMLRAQAHYVRARLSTAGAADARRDYASALRLLEEIKSEEGNQNLLKRADLAAMHAECLKGSKAP
jgi:tetratricopeptide (TPR) repeat protein